MTSAFLTLGRDRFPADAFRPVPKDAVWHPTLAAALASLPGGKTTFWGIPFDLASTDVADRWVWLGPGAANAVTVEARAFASHVVLAAFATPSRASVTPGAPDGRPSGIDVEPGEHLGDIAFVGPDGRERRAPIRRRFEIGDLVVAWGHLPFRARPHHGLAARDPLGPHAVGEWGEDQTSVNVPAFWITSPRWPEVSMPGNYWLHAVRRPGGAGPVGTIRLEATGRSLFALAAMTLFRGRDDPLRHLSRETLLVERESDDVPFVPRVDLGVVARTAVLAPPRLSAPGATRGWGSPRDDAPTRRFVVEVAAAEDAILEVEGRRVAMRSLRGRGQATLSTGTQITLLPPAERWLEVTVRDAETSAPTACRVHIAAPDGRYLAPLGHRADVNDGWFEDYGADLLLGGTPYAYVDGHFRVRVPGGPIEVEVAGGFEYEPIRKTVHVGPEQSELELVRPRVLHAAANGWLAADTHVHFLSPDTARLEARAEGIDVVHLLASQWGELYSNVGDFGTVAEAGFGKVIVRVGTENRHHLLGHISLLGITERLPAPMGGGGPEESGIGDPTEVALADWADEAHRQGGLAVIPHFPTPLAELVADVLLGKVDAVEIRDFTWGIESFAVREWYRLLNAGFRLPAVGGTDKMSAGIPIGGVRTYAHVGAERTFDAWQAAVRSGRTLTTSGPLVELVVEGVAPGGQVPLGDGQATLDVEATARSILPVSRLEVVHNGAVVAATDGPARHLRLAERLPLGPGWVAARTLGPARLWHVWPIALAAHTSPIYLTGRAASVEAGDVQYLGLLLEGGLAWLDTLATGPRGPASEHLRGVFSDAQRRLGELQRPSRVDARTPRAGARGARPS